MARLVLSGLKSQRHQIGVMFRSWAVVPVHLPINLPIALIKTTPFLPWVNLKGVSWVGYGGVTRARSHRHAGASI